MFKFAPFADSLEENGVRVRELGIGSVRDVRHIVGHDVVGMIPSKSQLPASLNLKIAV